MPRVHPRQSWYFSLCTFSMPIAFILATPHSSAFLSAGVPVTREPMSSLSSVRYWKACESIIPSPAILTSAGFVPSSSGPFGAGRLSARAVHAPPKENPSATAAAPAKTHRIRLLLTPFAQTDSITVSDVLGIEPFPGGAGPQLPPSPLLYRRSFAAVGRIAFPLPVTKPKPRSPFVFTASHSAPYTAICGHDETFRASASLPPNLVATSPHRICHARCPRTAARPKARSKDLREKGRKGSPARERSDSRPN